LKNSAYFTD